MDCTTYYRKTESIIAGERCPLPLEVIPNHLGINLCSVKGISWTRQADGQLVDLKIHFLPRVDEHA